MGFRIMMAVATKDRHVDAKIVFTHRLQEPVERPQRQCIVTLIAATHMGQQGEIMPALGHHQMIIAVAEDINIPMVVIAPLGGRAGVIPVMLALIDALGTTCTGRTAIAGGGGFQNGTIAGYDEVLQIRYQPFLDIGFNAQLNVQIFQYLVQILWSRFFLIFQQCPSEFFRLRMIRIETILFSFLLIFQVSFMQTGVVFGTSDLVFALARLTVRSVDDTLHEIIIGPDTGGGAGLKTGQDGDQRIKASASNPVCDALFSKNSHQDQRAQHACRVLCFLTLSGRVE